MRYYKRNTLAKKKDKYYFLECGIVFIFVTLIIISFFGYPLKEVFSQEEKTLSTDSVPRAARLSTSFENRRNPFVNWFPEKIVQLNETINITLPIFDRPSFDMAKLRLQGVIWSLTDSRALINNKIFKLGDEIDGAKIIKIDKKGVTFSFNEEEYFLHVPEVLKREDTNETANNQIQDSPDYSE